MGWYEEFKKVVGTAAGQVINSGGAARAKASSRKDQLFFTKHALAKMKGWGISEHDCYDVYYHGSMVKQNMMVRKYSGYEVGIWFFPDRFTGKAIISSAWKRERR